MKDAGAFKKPVTV